MNGSDSSPNFDWLTKGAPKKQQDSPPEQLPGFLEISSGTGESPDEESRCRPEADDEEAHLLNEAPEIPDAILNESDGTTLIIHRQDPVPGGGGFVDHEPVREEFLSSGEEASDVPPGDSNVLGELGIPPSSAVTEQISMLASDDGHSDLDSANSGETALLPLDNVSLESSVGEETWESDTPAQPDHEQPVAVDGPEQEEGSESVVAEGPSPHPDRETLVEESEELVGESDSGGAEVAASPASHGRGPVEGGGQAWPSLFPHDERATSQPLPGSLVFGAAASLGSGSESAAKSLHSAGKPEGTGAGRMFVLLVSYASAVTIALLALLIRQIYDNGHPHQLESLPDVPVQKENELTYVAPYSGLPRGHTLQLGESQRFGNIEVTPLAVTEAPVEFVHYSGEAQRKRPATQPVWKLKLLLKNVSTDQRIAPLDRRLVLRRVSRAGQEVEFTNYFITEKGTRDHHAPLVQIYRLPVDSDWDMAGQELGKVLAPGESYETYLAASEDETSHLPEHLVWRVQIRKGYSHSGNGVTTIFQVAFEKSQVAPET